MKQQRNVLNLNNIRSCLNSFLPFPAEAERCFSASQLFACKLISPLSDEMINLYCFLSSHFMRK